MLETSGCKHDAAPGEVGKIHLALSLRLPETCMSTLQSCWLTQGARCEIPAWCEPCGCTVLVGEAKQLAGARISGEERGGTRRQKLEEKRKGGSRLLYLSAPWGTADSWQRESGAGRAVLGRCQSVLTAHVLWCCGDLQGPCSDGSAEEFSVGLEQSFSMNKSTSTYRCSLGTGWCSVIGNMLCCAPSARGLS